ncbi:MAG: T9SS type A sorting domain-containing protein [Ignavibacteria bacterium]|nr:T9SS type A sorting domain-containing protein [Ignavibacteria bacterium]MBI3765788.1 T9SS type A sorting domain-containing protein [Ignavibacteriales bacterium]
MKHVSFVVLLLLLIAGSLIAGQTYTGLKGPAAGVQPTIITMSKAQGTPVVLGAGFQPHSAPGYLSTTGHELDVKFSTVPANVQLGGTSGAGTSTILAPSSGTSFDATVQNGWIPYDASVAVGPNNIVVCTNAQIEVYSRAGAFQARYSTDPGSGSDFFPTDAGVSFDPKCYYDAAGGHFVLLYDQESNPLAFMNVAVSVTSDPTGSWYKYHLDWTLDGSTPTSNWGDYPSLGYDNNSIYIGANQYSFANSYKYSKVRVLSKAQLYSGASATWVDFINLLNADGTSAFTVKAGRMLSSSTSEYLLNTRPGGGSSVTTWRIDNGPTSPTLTQVATVSVGTYAVPPNGRQPGGSSVADGDCRTQDLVIQGTTLYTAFSEKYGGRQPFNRGAGCRYLEVSTTGTKLADISFFTTGVDRYYPAVTVDASGNVFMVYNQSSTTQYASMYSTGINKGIGETGFETGALIKSGAGTVTSGRWGDYNAIANDFTNTGACWMFAGWAQSNGAWGTHVASASFGVAPTTHPQNMVTEGLVHSFVLNANYPNPFNPTTMISYTLSQETQAKLVVFDVLGRQIATLVDGVQTAGDHQTLFDASNYPSGIYYYRLNAGSNVSIGKMMLMK